LDYFANGRVTEPTGNADGLVDHVPNEIYRTNDGGWLAVTARDDDDWRRLCKAIQRTDLAVDDRLFSEDGRRAHRTEVDAAVGQWVSNQSAEEGMVVLQGAGVPAGKVQNAADLLADEQLQARDFWREFDHPYFGIRPFDRFPAIWSRSRLEPYLRSPYFGEHNFEIYGDVAGMTEEEIAIAIGDGLFR
jgi:crotonobetainyl-CoA:carnitine CoA-transferase CaiB-like acyl-CoA transferase